MKIVTTSFFLFVDDKFSKKKKNNQIVEIRKGDYMLNALT